MKNKSGRKFVYFQHSIQFKVMIERGGGGYKTPGLVNCKQYTLPAE